jgi:hypothetical protein
MKVTATRATWVDTDKGEALLQKGESAEVDGRTYGDSHLFVKAGYLVAEKKDSKPKQERKPKYEFGPSDDSDDSEA